MIRNDLAPSPVRVHITYHYLFPQWTMGWVVPGEWKWLDLRTVMRNAIRADAILGEDRRAQFPVAGSGPEFQWSFSSGNWAASPDRRRRHREDVAMEGSSLFSKASFIGALHLGRKAIGSELSSPGCAGGSRG